LIENFAHSIGFGKGHVIIPLIENSLLAGKVDEENGQGKESGKTASHYAGIINHVLSV